MAKRISDATVPVATTLAGGYVSQWDKAGNTSAESATTALVARHVMAVETFDWTGGATGAVARTLAARLLDAVSVKDFGADPTGVADSTTAFTNAFAKAAAATGISIGIGTLKGATVLVPPGLYLVGPLSLPANVTLLGTGGPYGPGYSFDGPVWLMQKSGYTSGQAMITMAANATLRDLALLGDISVANIDAISLTDDCRVIDCRVINWSRSSVRMPSASSRVRIEGGYMEGLRNVSSYATPQGVVHSASDFTDSYLLGTEISGGITYGTLKDATNKSASSVYLFNANNVWINKCLIENGDRGILVGNFAQNCHVVDNRVELCNAELLYFTPQGYNNVITNNIFGSGGMAAANTYDWLVLEGDMYQCVVANNEFVQYASVAASNKAARYLISDRLFPGRSSDKANSYSNNRFQASGSNGMTGAIYSSGYFNSASGAPYRLDGFLLDQQSGTSMTPDGNFATAWRYTATGALTINNPTNLLPGQIYAITIIQDATGGRAVTWGSQYYFAFGAWSNTGNTANKASSQLFLARSATELWQVTTQLGYT